MVTARLGSSRSQRVTVKQHRDRLGEIPRGRWIGLLLLSVLASALPSIAAAGDRDLQPPPWEPPRLAQQAYPQQPGNPWSFRPRSPTNARGVPPASTSGQAPPSGYPQPGTWQQMPPKYPGSGTSNPYPGAYPAQQPGGYPGSPSYGTSRQGSSPTVRPSLEVNLHETQAYVQQPVLVQLDVVSFGNLATASPELAGFDSILLEEVSGPTTSVRSSGRDRQIVNSYVLAMTPLRAGSLEVGPFEVSGTLAGGVPFSAEASTHSRLEVRPVVASVRPWLPLRALQLTRELDESAALAEGQPTTLTLRMQATGGTGAQLPDLEPMLQSNDFRAYREQTIIDTRLSADGTVLEGIRTEIYTLVPYSGGRLQLPELRINWWNLETARRESSSVPIKNVSVAGESGPFGFGRGSGWLGDRGGSRTKSEVGSKGEGWSWFWIPVGSIMLLLIGYWAGVWYRIKRPGSSNADERAARDRTISRAPLSQRMAGTGTRLGSRLGAGLRTGLRRLDPRAAAATIWRGLQTGLRKLMPASMRVYHCAIEAERASSASEWVLRFKSSACQSLRTPNREPLPHLADRILRLRPGADGARVRRLIQELDDALYNGAKLDMRRWKRELRRALRPGWGAFRGLIGDRLQRARLPALNPSSSGR